MTLQQERIKKIMELDKDLTLTYDKVLNGVENDKQCQKFEYFQDEPIKLIKEQKLGIEFFTLLGFIFTFYYDFKLWISILRNYFKYLKNKNDKPKLSGVTVTRKTYRFILKYFIQTHIRRQLVKLHKIYLREIYTQTLNEQSSYEVDELRKRSTDIKNYYETLPSAKRSIIPTIAISSLIIGLLQMPLIYDTVVIPLELVPISYALPLVIIVGISVTFFITLPLMKAFRIKRSLFLNTKSFYHYADLYLGDVDIIYKKSIYKKENDLYASLEYENHKPREIPIDKILLIVIGSAIFIMMTSAMISVIQDDLKNSAIIWYEHLGTWMMSLVLGIFAFALFLLPILEHKKRMQLNLI
ncbi:hypothetical protein [Nitrosopumilus sp.]|uniref:hypothetical protein n=1 Tax=Nitrosopumilus sp. TaxID=2024843 RepID=UPI00247C1ED9|nr:hypothetical protein [Nitrosopumilus sp.]MCV0411167.1 hypothetical protein [Nitrosopumilus sp.]